MTITSMVLIKMLERWMNYFMESNAIVKIIAVSIGVYTVIVVWQVLSWSRGAINKGNLVKKLLISLIGITFFSLTVGWLVLHPKDGLTKAVLQGLRTMI